MIQGKGTPVKLEGRNPNDETKKITQPGCAPCHSESRLRPKNLAPTSVRSVRADRLRGQILRSQATFRMTRVGAGVHSDGRSPLTLSPGVPGERGPDSSSLSLVRNGTIGFPGSPSLKSY